ncbi:MAG: hypothetical protein BAJATHORv1_110041 [Candidatus Thorarchaeota archaeon]|nr:MAG: hypothetical protein BAJATHORv1_110041 [Candidatus Thorarchaeota archaeon]
MLNWTPTTQKGSRRHAVFDPKGEDEMFDRPIQRILGADN